MKKFMSVLMALVMVFSLVTVGFAGFKDEAQLQFDENGNFKIMVLADVQTDYPVPDDMITFIREALDYAQPDLVVFCGDNINNPDDRSYDEVLAPLIYRGVPFTGVLGK